MEGCHSSDDSFAASQPHYRYVGLRCVELGAGVGLVGLLLAMMGAKVQIGIWLRNLLAELVPHRPE